MKRLSSQLLLSRLPIYEIKYFLFLLFLQFGFETSCLAKGGSDQKRTLQKACSLIEAGYHDRAAIILNKIRKEPQKEIYLLQALTMLARILNENGDRVRAIEQLESILRTPILNVPQNTPIKADAYLTLAECYSGLSKMEDFKGVSDTILRLAIIYHLPALYRARAYTNLVRYYAYNIIPNTGKRYLDSAFSLYNKASAQNKKYYNPIALHTASIDLNRDLDRNKIDPEIKCVVKLIKGGYGRERYNQTLLWRDIGGVYLDSITNKEQKKAIRKRQYLKAFFAYQQAATILKKEYPFNHIDELRVDNLCGLLNYNWGLFSLSKKYFNLSEAILVKYTPPVDKYTFIYSNTYLWESGVKNYVYHGNTLFKKKEEELNKWIQLAPYWQKWQQDNQSKSLHYFRDIYTQNPYNNIVSLCYQLYQTKKDRKYIDLAFKAQESSKANFLNEEYKKRYHLPEPKLLNTKDIQHRLSPGQAIISFSDQASYYQRLYAIVMTPDTVVIQEINSNPQNGFNLMQIPDSICNNVLSFKKYYYAAYEAVFKPVKKLLDSRINEILIYPSTLSSSFKFDMMVADTTGVKSFDQLHYLSNRYQIRYDFSCRFACLRDKMTKEYKTSLTDKQAYIPNYIGTRFYSLPFFNHLGDLLKSTWGFQIFDQATATANSYQINAGKARILQLAGHSVTDQFAAENLKMVMDSARQRDIRFLTMDKILNTRLQSELTVLALCETGRGDTRVQDSYLNMAYWFTYAGSKSCLFSYWKLDDRSTSFILKRFYHYLSSGTKKSVALKLAQVDYLSQAKSEEEKNPIYWGGLTLMGDDSPIKLNENSRVQYYGVAVLLVIAIIAFIRKKRKQLIDNYQNFDSDNKYNASF